MALILLFLGSKCQKYKLRLKLRKCSVVLFCNFVIVESVSLNSETAGSLEQIINSQSSAKLSAGTMTHINQSSAQIFQLIIHGVL